MFLRSELAAGGLRSSARRLLRAPAPTPEEKAAERCHDRGRDLRPSPALRRGPALASLEHCASFLSVRSYVSPRPPEDEGGLCRSRDRLPRLPRAGRPVRVSTASHGERRP